MNQLVDYFQDQGYSNDRNEFRKAAEEQATLEGISVVEFPQRSKSAIEQAGMSIGQADAAVICGELQTLQPLVSPKDLEQAINAEAARSGVSSEHVAREVLREQRLKHGGEPRREVAEGSCTDRSIDMKPHGVGTVGYIPVKVAGLRGVGHVFMYGWDNTFMEADVKQGVHGNGAFSKKMCPGAKNAVVASTHEDRVWADRFFFSKFGHPYNYNFAVNKFVHGNPPPPWQERKSSYNCSQIVWASFKWSNESIDLDGDGGTGVYPKDVLYDDQMTIIETY